MADTSSTHTVNVDSNIKQTTKEAEGLNAALGKAAATAQRIASPIANARKAKNMDAGAELGRESGIARSIGPGTGASGRDFAKQSEGLGGLVRLYATFAANIFAATAAFGALSRAADTTNMVKGLDQLGAASGRSLGTLAKDVARATNGAVSLRESIEAVSKASSAGLSNAQIKDIGIYAGKAAQTLGVSVPDALSRLTRGISKLEPELLDEIGIFIRIDKAVADYARTVGKSVSALTDFERRQAFANATLDQAKEKFGAINIDVNPYTKLSASLQNLTFSLLELVNKGLGPVANLFAENAILLGGAIGYVATKLLRTAIPAINQWRTGIVKAAEEAEKKARDINTSFGISTALDWEKRLNIEGLKRATKTAEQEFLALSKKKPSSILQEKTSPVAVTRLEAAGAAATGKQISEVVRVSKKKQEALEKELAITKQVENENTIKFRKEIAYYDELIAKSRAYTAAKKAESNAYDIISEAAPSKQEWSRGKVQDKATTRATTLKALSVVSDDTMRGGISTAMANLDKELNDKSIKGITRFTTRAKGLLSALTTSVGIFASAVSGYLFVFTLAATAIGALLTYFSNTKKEAEASAEAFDTLNGAIKTTSDTLEKISLMEDPLKAISVESLQAKATAMKELGDAAVTTAERTFNELEAMNLGDQLINFFESMWGGDTQNKFAESMAETITMAFKVADDSEATEASKKYIEGILGASVTDLESLESALDAIAQSKNKLTAANIAKEIQKIGMAAAVSAARGTELVEGLKATSKEAQNFINSLAASTPLSKMAENGIADMARLSAAIQDPAQQLVAMTRTAGDVETLKLFPEENIVALVRTSEELDNITASMIGVNNALAAYEQAEKDLFQEHQKNVAELSPVESTAQYDFGQLNEYTRKLAELKAAKDYQIDVKMKLIAETQEIAKIFDTAIQSKLQADAKRISAAIAEEMTKANNLVNSVIAGALSGTRLGIKMQADIERDSIKASMAVANESYNLALTMEKANYLKEKELLEVKEKKEGKLDDKDTTRRNVIDKVLAKFTDFAAKKNIGFTPGQLSGKEKIDPEVSGLVNKLQAIAVKLKVGEMQLKALNLKTEIETFSQVTESTIKEREERKKIYEIQSKQLDIAKEYGAETTEQYLILKSNKEFDIETEGRMFNYIRLVSTLAQRQNLRKNISQENLELFDEEVQLLQSQVQTANSLLSKEERLQFDRNRSAIALFRINKLYEETDKQTAIIIAHRNQLVDLQNEDLSLEEQKLDAYSKLEHASKSVIANELEIIKLKKLQIEEQNAITEATRAYQGKTQNILKERDKTQAGLDNIPNTFENKGAREALEARKGELTADFQREQVAYSATVAILKEIFGVKAEILAITAEEAKYQGVLNDLLKYQEERLEKINDFSESLGVVFTDLASIIKEVGTSITDMLNRQEAYSIALGRQKDIVAEINGLENDGLALTNEQKNKRVTAEKEISKISARNAQQEIGDTAKIFGATKMLFKEKTFAYKALGAIEKALHVARIAMMIKEVVTSLMSTPVIVGNNMTKAASGGITATIDAMKGLTTPFNFIAGAAMAAYVASILSGGKGSAPPIGATAAEQQSTQGTDQYYENGALVSTGAGVLGDKTAKSESVVKGIETLSKHSFDTLVYSNKMLDALIHIEENTKAFVGTLLKRIPGLTTPAQGTESGNWFSGKTTTNVIDQGIILSGTLGELADGFGKIIKYTNTVTEDDGLFGFIGGGTDYSGALETIQNADLTKFVGLMIGDMGIALSEAGTTLGMGTAKDIITGFRSLDLGNVLKTSIMGLDGTESAEELLAVISSGLDVGAKKLFPTLDKFWTDPSESFADTLIRLANNMTTVDLSLESIGMSIEKVAETGARASIEQLQKVTIAQQKYNEALADTQNTYVVSGTSEYGDSTYTWQETKTVNPNAAANLEAASAALTAAIAEVERASVGFTTNNIDLYESLIKASGGLDKFVERNEFFTSNFLTEAERLAPIQARVTEMMTTLGYASIDTREGFANIVKGLDLTDEAQRNTYIGLMSVAKGFAEVHPETRKLVSAEETLSKLRSQEIEIAKLEGRATDALNMERADVLKELATYGNAELITNQNRIFLLQDEAKARKLNTDLLAAEGKGYDNLLAVRAEELRTLTDAERVIKNQIYAAQDLEKLHKLDIDLLQAQGKASEALAMSRVDELKSLSPLEQETKKLIYAEQDLSKTKGLQVSLLEAEGKAYETLLIKREQELIALSDTDKAIQTLINSTQDMQKTADLETAALSAMGYTYEATYRTRQKELLALSDTDKAIQQFINTQTDLLVTAGLEAELMEASGDAAGALYARRKQELRGLSATDQVLKIRIWRLQDEAALLATFNSQQIKAMELLGNKAGALALTRKLELETIDSQLRPHQEYIYALEDEASLKEELIQAYDKESSAIKNTISTLEDSSRALKDYKNSLMLSDKSTAKPDEKYKIAKQIALDTAARATGPATTEAEIKARDAAVAKLPEATDAWLEASRTLYASSQSYSNDYSLALSLLDTVGASLDSQLSDAQKQLEELEDANTYLNSIAEATRSVEQIMADLLIAQQNTAAALANLPAGTTWGNSGVSATNVGATMTAGESGVYGALDSIVTGTAGYVNTIEGARKDLLSTTTLAEDAQLYNTAVANGFTSTMIDAILGAEPGTALRWALERGFPTFAKGGYASGDALVGEQGPELVDFNSPGRVYSANNTAAMLGNTAELINEIKSLRQEVAKLREEQKEQTGHLIQSNYDANAKAAEKVVEGTQDASNAAIWKIKSAPKVA